MKIFSLLLGVGFCVLSGSSFGQDVPFRRVDIDSAFTGDGKALGDIDGDGFIDILVGGQKLVWYRAPGWAKTIIASGVDFGTDIEVGDVDNDGDLDVIAPDTLAKDNVQWFENPRPGGNPSTASWTKHVIGTFAGVGSPHPHDVAVGDIDGNGKLDVVTRRGRTTVWLQAHPDSWTKVDLANATPGFEGTALGDLDKDGDLELALNGYWMEAPVEKADGDTWVKHTIDPNWPADASVAIADLDKDGNMDVILSRSEGAGGRLVWYEAANPKKGPWTGHVIATAMDYVHTLETGDMDNDGDMDVIFAEMAQSTQKRVGFFKNGGNALNWTLQVVATTGSHNATVGDIGADGDIDIVGANWQGPPMQLWENLSSSRLPLDKNTYIQIDDKKGKYGEWTNPRWMKYFGLAAGNLTDDGFKDVVSGRYFYRNPGGDMSNGGANWPRVDLGFNVDANIILDIDGDAFGDVLTQAGDNAETEQTSTYLEIWWFEATDVAGAQWKRQNGARPVGRVPKAGDHVLAHNFGAAQIDMGGKPEIYVTSADGTYYFKVPEDANRMPRDWESVKITAGDGYNTCEVVADIDGDGHNDIIGTAAEAEDESQIIWWQNPRQPGKGDWKRFIVGSLNIERGAIAVADVDGDGNGDVIAAEETGSSTSRKGSIFWFKNPGKVTDSQMWPRKDVAGKYFSIQSLHAADLDRDGDIDFVAGEHRHSANVSLSEMGLFVFENDGRGQFTRKEIARGYDHHDGCKLVDLDGDGDMDIISTGWDDDHWRYVRLWRNNAIRPE